MMRYPVTHIQSYSSYSSNINGHQTGVSEKLVAQIDSNGNPRGKISRRRYRPSKDMEYTRELGPQEISRMMLPMHPSPQETQLAVATPSIFLEMTESFDPFRNDPFFKDF